MTKDVMRSAHWRALAGYPVIMERIMLLIKLSPMLVSLSIE